MYGVPPSVIQKYTFQHMQSHSFQLCPGSLFANICSLPCCPICIHIHRKDLFPTNTREKESHYRHRERLGRNQMKGCTSYRESAYKCHGIEEAGATQKRSLILCVCFNDYCTSHKVQCPCCRWIDLRVNDLCAPRVQQRCPICAIRPSSRRQPRPCFLATVHHRT